MSCRCQQCGKQYKVDLLIPDWLWEKIKPHSKPNGAGLLCGSCIIKNIEVFNLYGALHVNSVELPEEIESIPHIGYILSEEKEEEFKPGDILNRHYEELTKRRANKS